MLIFRKKCPLDPRDMRDILQFWDFLDPRDMCDMQLSDSLDPCDPRDMQLSDSLDPCDPLDMRIDYQKNTKIVCRACNVTCHRYT